MKRLQFEFETKLEFSCGITDHCFTLRCIPLSDGRQTIAEPEFMILPRSGSIWHSRDSFGNTLICGRMDEPHKEFSFRVRGEALTDNSCEASGTAQPFYRAYSPLTAAGEKLLAFYEENRPAGSDIRSRAEMLTECVFSRMTYQSGVTGVNTSAEDAFSMGSGVCQDYAHILLSLLRTEGIPCRYASGLAFEYGQTHAWVEIYDGSRWIGIDPTHNRYISGGYIKLCHGRDYSDCPIERGIYIGNADSLQTVFSKITEIQ
ncbi:MAG: transglutaminase domain-containing protein [Huintestinicola sp.]